VNEGRAFQSTPVFEDGRSRRRPDRPLLWARFNPRPSSKTGDPALRS